MHSLDLIEEEEGNILYNWVVVLSIADSCFRNNVEDVIDLKT